MSDLVDRIAFIKEAERLKNVLRSAYTSQGRQESTAEHTWRLCLMAITFADQMGAVDLSRVLKLCIIHDLGEAINGDTPAIHQNDVPNKSDREREDIQFLTRSLPPELRGEILALWEEYERGDTPEAQAVKALDKLETIIQHNQGDNPKDFNYVFNLDYGKKYTNITPLFVELRALVDEETKRRAQESGQLPNHRA
jgi:putative hydrolases of HD superfamily